MLKKNNIRITLMLVMTALILPAISFAQDVRLAEEWQSDDRRSICVDFRINSIDIDPKYRKNAVMLDRIDSLFNTLSQDSLIEIVSIEFCGTASPEGPSTFNRKLSHGRMISLEKFVRRRLDITEDVIVRNDQYIAWDHLIQLVTEDTTLPRREDVLRILKTEYPVVKDSQGRPLDGRIPQLRRLDNGAIWRLMNQRYFVQMRNAWFIVVTVRPADQEPEPEQEQATESETGTEPESESGSEEGAVVESEQQSEQGADVGSAQTPDFVDPEAMQGADPTMKQGLDSQLQGVAGKELESRTPLINVKMNALEVPLMIINAGAEVRITPYLSFDVMGHYSPYDYFRRDLKMRVFGIQPEIRYWFGESLVKGHFVGLHVPVSGFNVQLGGHRFQDGDHSDPNNPRNRALWGVGLSYGYAMPLGKSSNWGVEFTVGLGYLDVMYDVYEGVTNGRYIETIRRPYFGPTRLGIDFSYRFDYSKNRAKKAKSDKASK